MKLYFPKGHYDNKYRGRLFPLLKPFIKDHPITDEKRFKIYGLRRADYDFVEVMEEADLVILPMAWNYYIQLKKLPVAIAVIEKAKALNKSVWVVMLDDFGIPFPNYEHCTVFRLSGYRSQLPYNHLGFPVLIIDPLKEIYKTEQVFERPYSTIPTVGFCGLANNSPGHVVNEIAKILFRNLKFDLGVGFFEKEALISPSHLRAKLLNQLKQSKTILDNFVIRHKYRAGVTRKSNLEPTRIEFFDNIKNSDYTLCVRGAGNFSVRFYETLAMGRIPIIINMDGLWPLMETINWTEHAVWIEYNELHLLEEKLLAFHLNLDTTKLNNLFKCNRSLWVDHLKLHSFFQTKINDGKKSGD